MEMRKQALDEEKKRREELEKRLQEETSRRQKLIDREVKLREKQRAQVRTRKVQCRRLCDYILGHHPNYNQWSVQCHQEEVSYPLLST